jgi:hypothetical protein
VGCGGKSVAESVKWTKEGFYLRAAAEVDDLFGGGAAEGARYDLFSHSYACDECSLRDVPEVIPEVLWAGEVCFVFFVYFFPFECVSIYRVCCFDLLLPFGKSIGAVVFSCS